MAKRMPWPVQDTKKKPQQAKEELLGRRGCIQGYYMYKEEWEASFGEILTCEREPDRYAIAATKRGTVDGHLPWKLTGVCSLFLWCGSTIDCNVSGHKKYSVGPPKVDMKFHAPWFSMQLRRNSEAKEDVYLCDEDDFITKRLVVCCSNC